MSFSRQIKEEIAPVIGKDKHCQLSELAALFAFCGMIEYGEEDEYQLLFHTENELVAEKCDQLIAELFSISTMTLTKDQAYRNREHAYLVLVSEGEDSMTCLQALQLADENGNLRERGEELVSPMLVQRECCRRTFLRGAYLAVGSVSDPTRFYHIEFVCQTEGGAKQLQDMIATFEIDAKITARKKSWIVYVKDGDNLAELLRIIEAHQALLQLENLRIVKEMRNSINRQVNCDAANIQKTVTAAQDQVKDILYIEEHMGLSKLNEGLETVARARLEQQQATLKEIGETLGLGKSCVNHRFKKLKEIAEQLRSQEV